MRHLVEVSIDGPPEQLRERAIGVALFGLDAGYDTAENPIVRVRVNELRKRLTKYYLQVHDPEVRFEIAARGYRVEIVRTDAVAEVAAPQPVQETPSPHGRKWMWAVGAVGLCLLAIAALTVLKPGRPASSVLDQFWGPALDSKEPVLMCAGHPVVYRLSRRAQERLHGSRVDHYQGQTLEFRFPPGATLQGDDVVPVPDQYIGLGSAEAVARIHGFLQRRNREGEIRFGNDLNFSDLRKTPAVLIGAFQNRWTVEFMKGFRFVFETAENGVPCINDTQTGKTYVLEELQENGRTPKDYVLISRVLNAASGRFVIAAGGITQYGGHTVAEVLTEPEALKTMLGGAPADWPSKNLQILMKVQVIGKTAGPPELIELHQW